MGARHKGNLGAVDSDAPGMRYFKQSGYPIHDIPMRRYDTGEERASDGGVLLMPEQVGAKVEPGLLYCTTCKTFLRAEAVRLDMAHRAAAADGFDPRNVALVEPPPKAKREKPDPFKVTLDLFPQQPEHHHKRRSGRAAAR